MMPTPFNGWIASLSNGLTVIEEPPMPGEKSSWQKLLDRLTTQNLTITQLRLKRSGITLVCDHHKKSEGYCMAYEVSKMFFQGNEALAQGIGTIYQGLVFINWIDEYGNVRQDIRPLSEMRVHSTLRDKTNAQTNAGGPPGRTD